MRSRLSRRRRKKPMTRQAVNRALIKILAACEFNKHVTPHSLRHAFTTPSAVVEAPPVLAKALDWRERLILLTGVDPLLCLRCGGLRVRLSLGDRQRHLRALAVAQRDSS